MGLLKDLGQFVGAVVAASSPLQKAQGAAVSFLAVVAKLGGPIAAGYVTDAVPNLHAWIAGHTGLRPSLVPLAISAPIYALIFFFASFRAWRELKLHLSPRILARPPHLRDSLSKGYQGPAINAAPRMRRYVQVDVQPATAATLVDCDGIVTKLERMLPDKSIAEIRTEPGLCQWAGTNATKMNIRPGRHHPLNIAVADITDELPELEMSWADRPYNVRQELKKPAIYIFHLSLSAGGVADCPEYRTRIFVDVTRKGSDHIKVWQEPAVISS